MNEFDELMSDEEFAGYQAYMSGEYEEPAHLGDVSGEAWAFLFLLCCLGAVVGAMLAWIT